MTRKPFFFLLLLLIFLSFTQLWAQTSDPVTTFTRFDMTGFPQWARDLRRAEIVAFGSFPFMYLFSNFGMGLAGQNETGRVLAVAAGGSVLVAVVDYGIELYKRSRRARDIVNLPEGTPIIIRTPLYDETAAEGAQALSETE